MNKSIRPHNDGLQANEKSMKFQFLFFCVFAAAVMPFVSAIKQLRGNGTDIDDSIETVANYDAGSFTGSQESSSTFASNHDRRQLGLFDAFAQLFKKRCPKGDVGDTCSIKCKCQRPNSCEAGPQKCRAPGREGDKCSFARPCRSGLTCQSGSDTCRKSGRIGERCRLTRPCGEGFNCVDFVTAGRQMCVPDCTPMDEGTTKLIKERGFSGTGPFGKKWEGGVVPFVAECGMNDFELSRLAGGAHEIEKRTDIRFVRYDPKFHKNYVIFSDAIDDSANSWVGRKVDEGWQRVNLGADDWFLSDFSNVGTGAHELMHALGWPHTQSRPDRDEYVTINFENIESGREHNFRKENSAVYRDVQKCRPYNYGSTMHYSKSAFSKNGEDTITTKGGNKRIGLENLNAQDIEELQEFYFGTPKCSS